MSFLTDIQKEKLTKFVKFVVKELGIKNPPIIILQNGRGDLKTTANYNYSSTLDHKVIKINAKNRAMIDIMRSLGHELTHHKQWEDGELMVKPPDIGGNIEDVANAKAGAFLKMFGMRDNSIYESRINKQVK